MREFAYLKQIEPYRKQYETFPFPAIICDRSFLVYWSNQLARSGAGTLLTPGGMARLLQGQDTEHIWSALASNGFFQMNSGLPGGLGSVVFLPVLDTDRNVTGATVLLFDEEIAGRQALIRRMADAIAGSLRQNVGSIFGTMDDLAVKADLLRAGWLQAGLNEIGMEGYRLLRIAENLAIYSRFRTEDPAVHRRAMDLNAYLEEISDPVSEIGRTAGVPVVFSLPQRICAVLVDPPSLEIALFNLLHNSLFYTRRGNRVRLTAERERDTVRLTLADQGMGIPREQMERIWTPYHSYDHGGRGAGIGLGLAVVQSAAQANGASVELASTPGEGTVAVLHLPVASVSQPLSLRQETAGRRGDNRFSRLYVGLSDAMASPYRGDF